MKPKKAVKKVALRIDFPSLMGDSCQAALILHSSSGVMGVAW